MNEAESEPADMCRAKRARQWSAPGAPVSANSAGNMPSGGPEAELLGKLGEFVDLALAQAGAAIKA
ncbi:MAG: hypothetical protein WCS94_25535, partial [Verrucomicrobiota bacterium]